MIIKVFVKTGINQYKELTQKQLKSIIGVDKFSAYYEEFKTLVKNNDTKYLDYKVFSGGYVFYFESVNA